MACGSHACREAEDARPVDPDSERKGISAETTFLEDLSELAALEGRLWPLCDKRRRQGPPVGRRRPAPWC